MSDQNKARYDKSRRELSLTSMYFNRYLLIRYVTAGFFFANLYWFLVDCKINPNAVRTKKISFL